jgi:small subunit ribosomal protein S6
LANVEKKLYEGMFLVDTALAASDWDGTLAMIRRLLEKNEAEILSLRKWEERRLAYDIQGKGRGTYLLSYFKCDGGKLTDIERDVQLSEKVMRVLILKADKVTEADMNRETPAMQYERESMPQAAPVAPAAPAAAPRTEGPAVQG